MYHKVLNVSLPKSLEFVVEEEEDPLSSNEIWNWKSRVEVRTCSGQTAG